MSQDCSKSLTKIHRKRTFISICTSVSLLFVLLTMHAHADRRCFIMCYSNLSLVTISAWEATPLNNSLHKHTQQTKTPHTYTDTHTNTNTHYRSSGYRPHWRGEGRGHSSKVNSNFGHFFAFASMSLPVCEPHFSLLSIHSSLTPTSHCFDL